MPRVTPYIIHNRLVICCNLVTAAIYHGSCCRERRETGEVTSSTICFDSCQWVCMNVWWISPDTILMVFAGGRRWSKSMDRNSVIPSYETGCVDSSTPSPDAKPCRDAWNFDKCTSGCGSTRSVSLQRWFLTYSMSGVENRIPLYYNDNRVSMTTIRWYV